MRKAGPTEAEWERLTAETRQRMLDIWEGDASESDRYLCFVMQYLKNAWDRLPPDQRNRITEEKVLKRLIQLIQR